MALSKFEKAIRQQFPGKANAGLRAEIRRCSSAEGVRSLARTVALTAQGKAALAAVAGVYSEQTALRDFAAKVAEIVFDPEYYSGPWWVYCRGKRRLCSNFATAEAWAKYLERKLGSWALNGISVGKVVHQ